MSQVVKKHYWETLLCIRQTVRESSERWVAAVLIAGIVPTFRAYGETDSPKKAASKPGQTAQEQVLALDKRLIEAENTKDFDAVKAMVWNSPSALFFAKTVTAAEGSWAGFWGHDTVAEHLHDVIYGGPIRIDPDCSESNAVPPSSEVAETYVPVQIAVGYGGQQAVPRPFLILIERVKISSGWKMASDIAIPVPPAPAVVP